jgi:NAD(P)-dependent dehydrogenase (short-subunit alcohol dehydrogenase family)
MWVCPSAGIGLEFVRQLLARGDQVIAAVRDPMSASELWQLAANSNKPGACEIHQCDVTSEQSIDVSFYGRTTMQRPGSADCT